MYILSFYPDTCGEICQGVCVCGQGWHGWRDYVCEDARANKPENVEVRDLQITISI